MLYALFFRSKKIICLKSVTAGNKIKKDWLRLEHSVFWLVKRLFSTRKTGSCLFPKIQYVIVLVDYKSTTMLHRDYKSLRTENSELFIPKIQYVIVIVDYKSTTMLHRDYKSLRTVGCTSAMPNKILRLFFGHCMRFALSLFLRN